MVHRSRLAWPWTLLLLFTLPGASAESEERPVRTMEDCEAWLREEPRALSPVMCFGNLVRQEGHPAAPVRARLEAMMSVDPDDARPRLALGYALRFKDVARAEQLLDEAVELFARKGDLVGEGWARMHLFGHYSVTSRLEEAEDEAARAAEVAERADHPGLWANVIIERAILFGLRRSEFTWAWRMLRELELDPRFDELPLRARAHYYSTAALVADRLGLWETAYTYAEQLATEAGAAGRRQQMLGGQTLMVDYLAANKVSRATREEALVLARRSLELAVELGFEIEELNVRRALGQLLEGDEALAHLEEVERRSRANPFCRHLTGYALSSMGYHWLGRDPPRPETALGYFERAFTEAQGRDAPHEMVISLFDLATARLTAGPREEGIEVALRALDAVEYLAELQPADELGARTFSIRTGLYYTLVDHLLDDADGPPSVPDVELAFRIGERMRARVLRERLRAADAVRQPEIEEPRTALLRRISALQLRLFSAELEQAETRTLLAELERLELQEASLRDVGESSHATGSPSTENLRSPADVRAALDRDEALLSFLLSPDRRSDSWLVVVSREAETIHRLPPGPEIARTIRFWLGLIDQRDPDEAIAAARLYGELLNAALSELPDEVTRLIVIPDGLLHKAPVDALRTAPEAPPLAERFEITVVPSATVWIRLRRTASESGVEQQALFLGDPLTPGQSTLPAAWRGPVLFGAPVDRLPHARAEVRQALRSLGGRGRVLVGDDASEAFVKQLSPGRFGLLHFAAHAVVDDDWSDRSAILLTPGAPGEDGLLQTREVAELDLPGTVVTLSACRSAGGEWIAGEGVMSLAHAFFRAGAAAVVGSLWTLRDSEAEQMMEAFYRHLGRGDTVTSALAAAKRERIAAGAPPAAWSGLVVLGAGDRARWGPTVERSSSALLLGAALAGLMLLALLIWGTLSISRKRARSA